MQRRYELALVALIIAVYLVLLGRTLDHGYVWDDVPEIERNSSFERSLAEGIALTQVQRGVPELADLPSLQFGYDSYRPLLFASYWIDIHLWGRGARPLHATNIALGALAIMLAYLVARRWLRSAAVLVPTALFALHPMQIEAVAYISARGDVLAGLFALLATYCVLRGGTGWMIGGCVAFAASLLSKEAYIGLPFAIAAILASQPETRARWKAPLVLLVIAVAYVPFRSMMLSAHAATPFGDAFVHAPSYVIDYVRGFVLPFDLSIERLPATHPVVGWIVLAAAIALFMVRKQRAMWAGVAWLLVLLAPSLLVVSTMGVVGDRYFYLPMLGLGVAIVSAVASARAKLVRLIAVVGAIWGLMLLAVAWRQVPFWHDVSSLYRHAAELSPDSSRAQYRVAYLEIQKDRWDLAVPRLERAIALDPTNVQALNNLGVFYLRTQRFAEAEALLRRAVTVNPARFNTWLNLGLAQHAQGNRQAGCASIARALAINPRFASAREEQLRRCQ